VGGIGYTALISKKGMNMRPIFLTVVALALFAGCASAQTTRTNPSASSTRSTIPSSSSTSPASPCYSSTNPTSPCYSSTAPANPCYSAAAPNEPCSPTSTPYSSSAPAVSAPITTSPQAAPHAFTEDQAKARIEAIGYSSVSGLQKDANGIWRGKAMKDGKPVNVILDFKGSIVAN
jgi:hypothetical protein